ncbi:MAG: sugar phosphate isomerase/epimerase [Candidatus Omnitrophica bacterium]|nr:sugar phosphate isomerase/epimerase [Candidatus Omnitrophota bacterium]MCM8829080.1 sugar phosphate isomerase/epimerase [Candidatus Omnitrophota bacterium]
MSIPWKWAAYIDPDIYKTIDEIIGICKFSKIEALELNWRFTSGKTEKEIAEMGDKFKSAGIELYSFHLPFTQDDDISCFYETRRRESVKRLMTVMEQAAFSGCGAVVLHPTTSHYDVKIEGFDKYLVQMLKSLDQLIPVAEKLNLTICLENMLPGAEGERFGSKIEHFKVFREKCASKNFGFCLDTGHSFITYGPDGPEKFFDSIKDDISAFHIQDNPGDRDLHIPPGRGLVNWTSFFRKMAQLKFSFPATVEALPFAPAQGFKYSRQSWAKMFEDLNSLVENALKL